MKAELAIVRGGGDIATGIIYRLRRAGYRLLCLENRLPAAVRRPVAVARAMFDGFCEVEGMKAVRIDGNEDWEDDAVAVKADPAGECIATMSPALLVDATMTKRYTGTNKNMAPLVLAVGPGFNAPGQVHGVVETQRGHRLGRLITDGSAAPDTGTPGNMLGYGAERLLRAPKDGFVTPAKEIGDCVEAGETVAAVGGAEIKSKIAGVLRGLIHPSVYVPAGLKIGDVDPHGQRERCFTISDKALAVAGGVLEAVVSFRKHG